MATCQQLNKHGRCSLNMSSPEWCMSCNAPPKPDKPVKLNPPKAFGKAATNVDSSATFGHVNPALLSTRLLGTVDPRVISSKFDSKCICGRHINAGDAVGGLTTDILIGTEGDAVRFLLPNQNDYKLKWVCQECALLMSAGWDRFNHDEMSFITFEMERDTTHLRRHFRFTAHSCKIGMSFNVDDLTLANLPDKTSLVPAKVDYYRSSK